MRGERWPIRPVPAAAVLAIALCLGLYALQQVSLGPAREQRTASAVVTIEDAGMDSRRIERAITMPLEDAVAEIPGVSQIRSVSEYGRSRVTVIAGEGEGWAAMSLALREAVQRVAAGLPPTAQKPEIVSRSLSQRPVFVACLRAEGRGREELRDWVEQEVKPSFARVAGVGDVEAGGGAAREVHVLVDPRRAALRGLALSDVAGQIARQVVFAPAGSIAAGGERLTTSLAGRVSSLEELAGLPLSLPDGGGAAALSEIAVVEHGLHERESISRVDGSEAVVISIQSSGMANLIALSRGLRAETARWEARGLGFDIILDQGGALERAVRGIISALLQGLAVVTALLPLFVREGRRILVLAVSLPLTGLLAVAALTAARVSLDLDVMSGLAVGIGTILDTGIIVSEQRSVRAVRCLAPSLAASLATTLIVLVPLLFLEFASAGIRQVAIAIGLLLVLSFTIDVLFLPAFFLERRASVRPGREARDKPAVRLRPVDRLLRKTRRRALRGLHLLIDATIRRRGLVLAGAAVLVIGMAAAAALAGKDFSTSVEDTAVYAHVELEPGASIESVDERVLACTRRLMAAKGIVRVQSIARRGNAEVQVRYDPSRITRARAAALVQEAGSDIPRGFLYLPDAEAGTGRGIELALRGDDDGVLRELAAEAARLLSGAPGVRQVVLNFKEAPPGLIVTVDRHRAAAFGVRTAEVAGALRWALHGPVALKWIESDREMDLRVMQSGARQAGRSDLLAVPVRNAGGGVRPVGDLAALSVRAEGGKIFRTDRQRTASLTVHSSLRSIDAAAARILSELKGLRLPAGYAVELDREVRDLDRSFRLLWAALGLCALFLFIVLAGFGESLLSPVAVVSILPTSLAFPLIAATLLGEPLRVPLLVGFIMLSGMVVNNSILVIDAIRDRRGAGAGPAGEALRLALHAAIRRRIRPLLITSVATIAGTIPLLFARSQGAGYLSALAFVVFWGMLGSLVSTIMVIPALAAAAPVLVPPRPAAARGRDKELQ